MIVIAGNKHISNVWLKEPSFDQTPNYCLFCMPRPSHSCPKASCSLPRYVSMAVAPRQQNLPREPKRCQCPGTLQKGALVLRSSSPPYPTHLGGQAQGTRRIRITVGFPVTHHLKTPLLQNRCLASGLRVPTVQPVSSTAWSRTIYSQGFCPVLKKCCASCP